MRCTGRRREAQRVFGSRALRRALLLRLRQVWAHQNGISAQGWHGVPGLAGMLVVSITF